MERSHDDRLLFPWARDGQTDEDAGPAEGSSRDDHVCGFIIRRPGNGRYDRRPGGRAHLVIDDPLGQHCTTERARKAHRESAKRATLHPGSENPVMMRLAEAPAVTGRTGREGRAGGQVPSRRSKKNIDAGPGADPRRRAVCGEDRLLWVIDETLVEGAMVLGCRPSAATPVPCCAVSRLPKPARSGRSRLPFSRSGPAPALRLQHRR